MQKDVVFDSINSSVITFLVSCVSISGAVRLRATRAAVLTDEPSCALGKPYNRLLPLNYCFFLVVRDACARDTWNLKLKTCLSLAEGEVDEDGDKHEDGEEENDVEVEEQQEEQLIDRRIIQHVG